VQETKNVGQPKGTWNDIDQLGLKPQNEVHNTIQNSSFSH